MYSYNVLAQLGIRDTTAAFFYFSIAADLCRSKATPEQLYEAISNQVNVPPAQIQAELEAALDAFWAEGNISYYRQITGYAATEKPDVSELALAIHNYCF